MRRRRLIHLPALNVLLGFPIQLLGLLALPYLGVRYLIDGGDVSKDAEAYASTITKKLPGGEGGGWGAGVMAGQASFALHCDPGAGGQAGSKSGECGTQGLGRGGAADGHLPRIPPPATQAWRRSDRFSVFGRKACLLLKKSTRKNDPLCCQPQTPTLASPCVRLMLPVRRARFH
jgi:hypothetical protein